MPHVASFNPARVARQPQLGEFRVLCSTQSQVFRFQTRTILRRVESNLVRMTGGAKVKRFVIRGTAAAAFCGASALAADLPTKAPPALAPTTSCFASLYDYINSSAQDCALAWSGITLYGAIDIGADYVTHGVPFNGAMNSARARLNPGHPRLGLSIRNLCSQPTTRKKPITLPHNSSRYTDLRPIAGKRMLKTDP